MATKDTKSNQESSRDGLALIVGGIFILALVFAAYNYFNKPSRTGEVTEEATSTSVIERIREAISPDEDLGTGGPEEVLGEDAGEEMESVFAQWVATDYSQGDISKGTYTVKWGDTLWEISEAVYGDGSQWGQILEANSDSIGYLPNGQQALIMEGQQLVIP
jgi:nucleoid-associated protein YgaU